MSHIFIFYASIYGKVEVNWKLKTKLTGDAVSSAGGSSVYELTNQSRPRIKKEGPQRDRS